MADQQLDEAQATIYDRQLRVWGVETQKRLGSSNVLIVGCTGLAAEVAKNIVLAGVGGLTLVDDTPCSSAPPANFLVPAAADPASTVAEACVKTLAEMNPFVQVAAASGSAADALSPERLEGFNLVLLCGQPAHLIARADSLCREAGIAFYAAVARGITGWAFADLGQHSYVVEKEVEQKDGSKVKQTEQHEAAYPSWEAAARASLAGQSLRRTSKLFLVLRVVAAFEQQAQRHPTAADLPALRKLCQEVCQQAGADPGSVDAQLLEAYASHPQEMPAINAVVGGVLANEVLKAVAAKGEPLQNFFLFSLTDGAGMVERSGM